MLLMLKQAVQTPSGRRFSALVTTAIVLMSAAFATVLVWQAPGLDRYSHDWLMRLRGPIPVSNEIALVVIDDPSVARLGRFPWPRSVIARALDAIAADQPKVIAIDILFPDPTTPEDDRLLAAAVGRARNVILGAELVDRSVYGSQSQWLKPLAVLAAQAAAVGHVNVGTESDGSARQVLFEESDDAGDLIRALPVEAFRVGNRIGAEAVLAGAGQIAIGPLAVPAGSAQVHRAARIDIDYAGPPGAFAAQQYAISDLLDGKVAPGALRGKYVLIGSTAASLGERFASPFTHYSDAQGGQHGASMPGVEVLANALNTIVTGRFYSEMPGPASIVFAALAAWLMLVLLSISQGRRGALRLLVAVTLGLALILFASYECFARLLLFPPLFAALIAFGSAGVSGLAARSFEASAGLDRGIRRVLESLPQFGENPSADETAEAIVRLTGVTAALLVDAGTVVGAYGYPGPRPAGVPEKKNLPAGMLLTEVRLGGDRLVILAHPWQSPPLRNATRMAEALGLTAFDSPSAEPEPKLVPEALEDKARRMVALNDRIGRQAEFFRSCMRSVEDGLIVASPAGGIRFANSRAGTILDCSPAVLEHSDLFEVLSLPAAETLETLILNRQAVERELWLRSRSYTLRLAPVLRGEGVAYPVIGIVASLADVTRQHELAQTRSDVVTLVSHEMRTPLTAIQGMTELLAEYEIEPVRRKEMTLAINDEVKRLARMIGDYLDIAKLEMGTTPLRRVPIRLETLVERTLLLFEPLAEEKSIRLLRGFQTGLPPVLGDSDLLSRVFANLISNALKYSPAGTDVEISLRAADGHVVVQVEDHGYGIPAQDLDRVFEKFYRVPRLEDADVPGTGLGLTFVREIVELHGGSVIVQSSPSSGSVFSVCLPYGPQAQGR
jgi:signal transduction histidine kinase/CHASE2 domain-containing sensor protein